MNPFSIFAQHAVALVILWAASATHLPQAGILEARLRQAEAMRDHGLAAERGALWLVKHQDPDGSWRCAGFSERCPDKACSGHGEASHDVGVTGLALMALMTSGEYGGEKETGRAIERGVRWLQERCDPGSGRIGETDDFRWVYIHAVATVALAEAYGQRPDPELRASCDRAVACIMASRNPAGGWRYEARSAWSDTSVTAWMVHAIDAAFSAGLDVEAEAAFQGAHEFLRRMLDQSTGRVGYTERGSGSSRNPGLNDHYPVELTENLTAAALFSASMMGLSLHEPGESNKSIGLLVKTLPEYKRDGLSNDFLYWYYGTEALHRMRARHPEEWARWRTAVGRALGTSQERVGHSAGSWKPNGPWGHAGGRIAATALGVLALSRL